MEFHTFCHLSIWRVCTKMRIWTVLLLLLLLKSDVIVVYCGSSYSVGLGSYDITGPAADVNLMGYAKIEQVASGIHFRLRARTFVVVGSKGSRVVFVNLDACMGSQIVTTKVIERLKARYGEMYTEKNVAISGTHTHAGPGGYLQYFLYIITSYGFVRQSFDVIVDGIEKSIIQAHENLRPGSIFVDEGELLDAGVNRSPSAYLNNPASERSKYKYDVDKEMTLLKFVDDERGPVGSFSWFATHPTSMGRRNSLISGDNKGAAARFMEDWFDEKDSGRMDSDVDGNDGLPQRISNIIPGHCDNHHELLELASSFQSPPGRPVTKSSSVTRRVRGAPRIDDKPRFVAAFCQSNSGDVSPNVLGAFCLDTGLPCDFNHSTCGGRNEFCYGQGPSYPDEFESTRIIGERQFRKAADLFTAAAEEIEGEVDFRHAYIDFSKLEVTISDQGVDKVVKTCPAAMGFAFAAGTTDGPGSFDFKQGDDKGSHFWKLVRNLVKTISKKQIDCQHPKPILLDTGEMNIPYDWAPRLVAVSNKIAFANPNAPAYPRLALGKSWNEMTVTWTSGYGISDAEPFVEWNPKGGDHVHSPAGTLTFTRDSLCGAPARSVGWRDPGYIHTSHLKELWPNRIYEYKIGHKLKNGTYIWSKQYQFRAAPFPGQKSLQRVVIFGDMGKEEVDGSNEYNDFQHGSINTTTQLIQDLENIDMVFHIGDISYANGYLSQWDQFTAQVEPIASAVPYMIASGNHERDWPGSGSFYENMDSGGECGVLAETMFYVPASNRAKFWYCRHWLFV